MENEENLLAVLADKSIENLLTPAEIFKIQSKLWDALTKRVDSFTMGGGSSVRVETAQELLKSVGFVISHGFGHGTGGATPDAVIEHLLNDDFDTLFKAGLEAVKAQVAAGEALLRNAESTAVAVPNRAYGDTLRELGVFFKHYHYHHFAHDIPCMIDYPLAHPVDESLLGINYINEYLRRLLIENDLVRRFDAETVTSLLRGISPVYTEDLINIYEAVVSNALALTVLNGDIYRLDMTDRDRGRLYSLMKAWKEGDTLNKIRGAAAALCDGLDIAEAPARDYLADTAAGLWSRVKPLNSAGQYRTVFPPLFADNSQTAPPVTYIDGALMDDEKLRALINALTSCSCLSEKITLARQKLFSLRDWAEVLNICFWYGELDALFDAFTDEELDQVRRFAAHQQKRFPGWRSETGWEVRLTDYKRKQK